MFKYMLFLNNSLLCFLSLIMKTCAGKSDTEISLALFVYLATIASVKAIVFLVSLGKQKKKISSSDD